MAQALPFLAVSIQGFDTFWLGEKGVKQIGINPGMPGFLLVEVTIQETPNGPERIRRFQANPATAVFECGDPIDVPDPNAAPALFVPDHVASGRRSTI